MFSYLRSPPFLYVFLLVRFFLSLFVSREITILVSRDTPFLYLATKDVRVELNQAIGLNNSLFNEFVTVDVGIPKYSSRKREREEKEKYSTLIHIGQIFFPIQDSLLYLLFLQHTYCPCLTWLLRRLSGMSNVIRKTIKMHSQELLRVANKYVKCKSRQ